MTRQNKGHPQTSIMGSLIRPLRSLVNGFGLAWWARVETREPNVTYWFGPFVTRKSLEVKLSTFVADLSLEGPASVNHTLLRCRRVEPLTITVEGWSDD
ncbi:MULTISPECIES: DUF1816 domain-containing protein [unclassified Prochlorococcus]|uniref:DUF1816 domain-containing protein n=1 Tax=unclassified Prochlorococcus TaxID=2627481 RepID=UPI0009DDE385|nr:MULTISPECIES: DUF1816 domain-containing protein [unclassified Prochlorococcus]